MIVDSHCHLDDTCFSIDRDAVVKRAQDAGVEYMMTIGTGDGPPDLEAAIRVAETYDNVYATVGVHPHDAAKVKPDTMKNLEALLRHPKVLAVGEIGLDYHYDHSPRDRQRAVFGEQLDIALRAGKPIVIHTREAWEDTFAILESRWVAEAGGIMHCFTGGPLEAERSLGLGFHISFSGIVTYPKATDIQAAARVVPSSKLLVETDAPYLAPVPHRGKRCEPGFVVETARKLAELRGETFEAVAEAASRNWFELARIDANGAGSAAVGLP
ncbi:MAG: TatD family hydrolase [Bryobacteraceae bacterium]